MSSNINFNELTGKAAFYSVRRKAWHKEGFISQEYQSSEEVLINAQLKFQVEKAPLVYNFPSGKTIISDTDFFTFRSDTEKILGTNLSKDFTPIQNADAFRLLDSLVKTGQAKYETAGALGEGEKVFITMKLPDHIKVGNDDITEIYLFITLFHNGANSIVALTPTRIVCNNTLNAALQNCTHKIKIDHNLDIQAQLKEVEKVFGMVEKTVPLLEEKFNRWSKVQIKDAELFQLIQKAMAPDATTIDLLKKGAFEDCSGRYKNLVYSCFGYALQADSQKLDTTKNTVFGAYNAVTGYFQNVKDYKSTEDQLDSIIYGGTAQKKAQAAFDLCDAFAQHGQSALFAAN